MNISVKHSIEATDKQPYKNNSNKKANQDDDKSFAQKLYYDGRFFCACNLFDPNLPISPDIKCNGKVNKVETCNQKNGEPDTADNNHILHFIPDPLVSCIRIEDFFFKRE